MSAVPPYVDGTVQWSVPVIDSSESGHGTTDTRHKRGADGRNHDGLGRGVFRLVGECAGAGQRLQLEHDEGLAVRRA